MSALLEIVFNDFFVVMRLAGNGSKLENEDLTMYITRATYLTVFIYRKGANDEIMKVVGASCPFLQVYYYALILASVFLYRFLQFCYFYKRKLVQKLHTWHPVSNFVFGKKNL